jgi:hypothetical protein
MSLFFFYKIRKQEGRTGPGWVGGNSGRGEEMKKEGRRVNVVQILCIHVCKWKMRPLELFQELGSGEKRRILVEVN